jgi:hypothetical protein
MFAASLFLLFQSAASGPSSPAFRTDPQMQSPAPRAFDVERERRVIDPEEELKIRAAYEDHELVKRLNTLLSLLQEFAANYNAGKVDVKRINRVRKAWHDLEKSEWFRPPKTN